MLRRAGQAIGVRGVSDEVREPVEGDGYAVGKDEAVYVDVA
jgi:hypothetical protein